MQKKQPVWRPECGMEAQGGHVAAGQWGGQRGDEARSDTGLCGVGGLGVRASV